MKPTRIPHDFAPGCRRRDARDSQLRAALCGLGLIVLLAAATTILAHLGGAA